ncbi:MAG: Kelch repeat-containing protein [Cyclobacteriaceae bacterium]
MQKLFFPLLFIAGIIMISCQEDEEPITPPVASDTTSVDSTVVVSIDLKGYVQKGPFINSTAITLSELNEKLTATGKNFTTQIADNRGSFSLKDIELESDFVQLQANGFYFDEVKGEKSAAQLTLFALADVSNASSVNVNLLSHLERNRVVYLMQEEKQEFAEAKKQAQQEILTAFGIVQDSIGYSEQLDISQKGDQHAILLAISAVLQGNNGVADLSELLGNLITDLREDGTLNSEVIQTGLKEQAKTLDLSQIRQNLEARYAEMGVEATIPNFEQYIDSDGDGILNKDEDDTPEDFAFETQVDVAINDTITSNAVIITGLIERSVSIASVTNGWLVVNNDENKSSIAEVRNGDNLEIRLVSSQEALDTTTATITIGELEKTFSVITDDYSPDDFSFNNIINAQLDRYYTSNTITLSGIPHPTPISSEFGTLYINETEVVGDSVTVKDGDKIFLILRSGSEYLVSTSANIIIGAKQFDFLISTYEDPWKRLADYPGTLFDDYATAVNFVINDKIYFGVGFYDGYVRFSPEFYEYDPAANLWTRKQNFPGNLYGDPISFSLLGDGYIRKGEAGENDFWKYDPQSDQWTQIATYPDHTSWQSPIAFVANNKAYMGAGVDGAGRKNKVFWEFDPVTITWTRVADYPYEIRRRPNHVVTYNDKGYILSASPRDNTLSQVIEYSPKTNRWSTISPEINVQDVSIEDSDDAFGFLSPGLPYDRTIYRFDYREKKWIRIRAPRNLTDQIYSFTINDKIYVLVNNSGPRMRITELWEYTPPPIQD